LWCISCLKKYSLIAPALEEENKESNPSNSEKLEEILHTIAYEATQEAMEGQM